MAPAAGARHPAAWAAAWVARLSSSHPWAMLVSRLGYCGLGTVHSHAGPSLLNSLACMQPMPACLQWCPTCPDALLAVACALELAHVAVGVHCAQEHGFELVHAGICEQQRGVVQRHLAAQNTHAHRQTA